MDQKETIEGYDTLRIKSSVAAEFRKICKSTSKSRSVTLLMLIEFFEEREDFRSKIIEPRIQELEDLIKKRTGGVIAVIKLMEKNQTRPILAMLQTLFEEAEPKEVPLRVEKRAGCGNGVLKRKATENH